MAQKKHLVVIGGGISGLSLSWFLRPLLLQSQEAIQLTILEAAPRTGGWIATSHPTPNHRSNQLNHGTEDSSNRISRSNPEFLFETGPRGFRPKRNGVEILALIEELGLQDSVIASSTEANVRHLLQDGVVQKAPNTLMDFLTWPLNGMMLQACWNDIFAKAPKDHPTQDESIYDFISRRFSPHVAERLIDPVISGIYGGDIRKLSIISCLGILKELETKHGSIVRGLVSMSRGQKKDELLLDGRTKSDFIKAYEKGLSVSFQGGMETLTDALTQKMIAMKNAKIVTGAQVSTLKRVESSMGSPPHIEVTFHQEAAHASESGTNTTTTTTNKKRINKTTIQADHVFSMVPSFVMSDMVREESIELANQLASIEAVSMSVINVGYDDGNVLHQPGFGYLVPTREKQDILGVVYDSVAFPTQSHPLRKQSNGESRLTVMAGGAHHAWASTASSAALEDVALKALRKHLGITREPSMVQVNTFQKCIPQYNVGHAEKVEGIKRTLADIYDRQVSLGGNSFDGIGIADCVANTRSMALQFLQSTRKAV